jgi:hypothetical protein
VHTQVYSATVANNSGADKPVAKTSATEKLMAETSGADKPVAKTSATEKLMAETSGADKPVAKTSATEELMAETSGADKPVAKTSATEKLMAETSGADKPVAKTSGIKTFIGTIFPDGTSSVGEEEDEDHGWSIPDYMNAAFQVPPTEHSIINGICPKASWGELKKAWGAYENLAEARCGSSNGQGVKAYVKSAMQSTTQESILPKPWPSHLRPFGYVSVDDCIEDIMEGSAKDFQDLLSGRGVASTDPLPEVCVCVCWVGVFGC